MFRKEGTWVKRGENPPFYLTMGSFGGAEICEIIRIYLLEKLSPLLGKETLIYIVSSSSGLVLDSLRKDIISIFKNEALSITVEKNFNDRDKY